jgi:hypothetical protein
VRQTRDKHSATDLAANGEKEEEEEEFGIYV